MLKRVINIKRLWLLLFIPLSLLLVLIARNDPCLTETYFSRGFYVYYSNLVGIIFGWIPFSVGEFILIFNVIFWVAYLITAIVLSVKKRSFKSVLNYTLNIIAYASITLFLFTISCGLNYYRHEVKTYYESYDVVYTPLQLSELCKDIIIEGGKIGESLTEEMLDFDPNEMAKITQDTMDNLIDEYYLPPKVRSAPKSVFFSDGLSHTKITGMFFPFTFEANVNVAVTKYTIPFTMLHEQAHQMGFMSEDEANFLAWLAGKDSENEVVRYSAYMLAATYTMNSLYRADPELYAQTAQFYTDKQREHLSENNEYWEQYRDKPIAEAADKVNDNYLKANGQEQGIISYGEVTQLILAKYYEDEYE